MGALLHRALGLTSGADPPRRTTSHGTAAVEPTRESQLRRTTSRTWALMAGATGIALLASACGGGSDVGASGSTTDAAAGGEDITLTVATFNEFGYEDLLE